MRIARGGHRMLNFVLLVAIPVQFYAAGLGAFGLPFTFHAVLGWSLIPTSLILSTLAVIGYGRHAVTGLSSLLFVVVAMQPVFVFVLSRVAIALTALHPVNGLVAFLLALGIERRVAREQR